MKCNRFVTAASVLAVIGAVMASSGDDQDQVKSAPKPLPNCPIMDEPINLAVSTETDSGPVFFCCEGCIKKYKKDPAKYEANVADQRRVLADRPSVQTTCPVSKEPVNQKVFIESGGKKVYFCCQGCVGKYQNDPKKYTAALSNSYTFQTICPVMEKNIDPTSFTKLADGRTIYYCCDGCDGKLFGTPAKYAKHLANQGYQYNWAKIKKAGDDKESGHGHHDHGHHDHHDGGH